MTGMALVRSSRAVAWDLRAAWATGRRVSVTLEHGDRERVEGHVRRISATDAYVVIAAYHIPLDRVLAVHLPSRLGDSTVRTGAWAGPALAPTHHPAQIQFEIGPRRAA